MKKLLVTIAAVAGLAISSYAQGVTADNLNGGGTSTATSLGLFFNSNGTPYTGATVNMVLLGGTSAGSLAPIFTGTGANALVSFGGGQYADPNVGVYTVPGVAANGVAVLQVQAWIGSATTYANAPLTSQFLAWNGSALVSASAFTFNNQTGGGGTPATTPKSLDGMPAMVLGSGVIPEPSTLALFGLGAASLLIFRRRK